MKVTVPTFNCSGIACAPIAPECRQFQCSFAVVAMLQLLITLQQLVVQRRAAARFQLRVPGSTPVGLLQQRVIPIACATSIMLCLYAVDPFGTDGQLFGVRRYALL